MENHNSVDQKSADREPEPPTCFLGSAPLKEAVRQSELEKRKSVDQNRRAKLENPHVVTQKRSPKLENRNSVTQKEAPKPEKRKSVTQKPPANVSRGTFQALWTVGRGKGWKDNPTYPVTLLKNQFPENDDSVTQKPDANVSRGTFNFRRSNVEEERTTKSLSPSRYNPSVKVPRGTFDRSRLNVGGDLSATPRTPRETSSL